MKPSNVYGISTQAATPEASNEGSKSGLSDATSNTLRQRHHRYQSPFFELPNSMKVQKAGFKNRAGEALLEEGGSASVHDYVHANRTFQVRFRCDVEYATSATSSLSKSVF
ncbi:MAG TPA: hypothetical protein IAA29_07010 [Candidatus Paenibacillus intestinavium]|nr:hypothetical protein [Candidatus Paenibacillus intestinavium]